MRARVGQAWRRVLGGALALLFAALGPAHGAEVGPAVRGLGDPLPPLVLQDLAGEPHDLTEGYGKGPVLLFFWSVYCPNCKEAMPGLVELARKGGRRGLQIWAVNVDGDRFSNAVRAYVSDMELPFPVVYDRLEGEYLVAADPLGVSKTPTLFVSDDAGRIALRQSVEIDYDSVVEALSARGP